MKIERKVILWWSIFLLLSFASLSLPHRYFPLIGMINVALHVLLGLICLYTVAHENTQTKPIFINFAVYFLFAVCLQSTIFVGPLLFTSAPIATVYFHQYVHKIGFPLLLAFSVVYAAVDYIGRNLRVRQKYLVTSAIVLTVFLLPYSKYFVDPLHLYHRAEYAEYMEWDKVHKKAVANLHRELSDDELVRLFAAEHTQRHIAQSTTGYEVQLQKYRRYFGTANSTVLFWKPLEMSGLFINAFLLVTLSLVFLFKFLRDYPHPAYVEKILQTFFLVCALEILHYWSYSQSPSYEIYRSIHGVGQYLTISTLLLMVYVFSMRLRFVLNPFGKYYEGMITTQPDQITRWRDEIDNVILRYFFKGRKFLGRLVSLPSTNADTTNKQEQQP